MTKLRKVTADTAREGAYTDQDITALRDRLVDQLCIRSASVGMPLPPAVETALRKVPRHLFTLGVPPESAYGTDSIVAKRDERGVMLSTVSAPPTVATMLAQAGPLDGTHVLEIGSGGYNAALLRELVGPSGSVTTIDIDADVVQRAEECLAAAGYDDVRVLCRDGEFGVSDTGRPFDLIIVTAGAWDIPPAWTDQLAEGGRLVLPLRTFGLTRSWALERVSDHLESRSHLMCGFVPMQGAGGHQGHGVELRGDQVGLWFDEVEHADTAALGDVLATPRAEVWSGVTLGKGEPFHDLDLWLATHLDGFAVLTAQQDAVDSGVVTPSWRLGTPAVADAATLAYRAKLRPVDADKTTFEFGAYAHGPDAANLAVRFAEQIRQWDRHGRPAPHVTIHRSTTPITDMPAGFVLHKRHTAIVLAWPHLAR
ncbi:methyltransferase, FxLD system [Acrocarpospora catenulata]|uniref:methyltransferase, FxLD system n=1 Tax=Acrocarpospora catenulata TaxID=2836182 RepID=UPI0027DECE84|nr:methyltransferase, FxLD system [Acrocarpospora catenulata]